jgi:small subunit ribosomal protein S20
LGRVFSEDRLFVPRTLQNRQQGPDAPGIRLDLTLSPHPRYPEVFMANTFSAIKRMRTAARRTDVNRVRKTRLRHQIRAMRRLLDSKDANGAAALAPKTFSLIDRAAKWGIIKKNTAARYKSRLTIRLRKVAA